ncbi:EF-hand domain-containing protein [Streptomyces sp. 4F14]|uniref:EF-hand domain-containing protein n=1 Tax=Streptomyces sp. 4F14 TaxID=3394380 RepID=UPI003A862A23
MTSETWLPRVTAAFHGYDMDGDGQLTREDLTAYVHRMCQELGLDADASRRRALHDAYDELWTQLALVSDADRNGRIGEQEFVAATSRRAFDGSRAFRASTMRALDALADALDRNGDGVVDADEYARFFGSTGAASDPDLAFEALDTDGDGRLTRQEFMGVAAYLFPLADPASLPTPSRPPHRSGWGSPSSPTTPARPTSCPGPPATAPHSPGTASTEPAPPAPSSPAGPGST